MKENTYSWRSLDGLKLNLENTAFFYKKIRSESHFVGVSDRIVTGVKTLVEQPIYLLNFNKINNLIN